MSDTNDIKAEADRIVAKYISRSLRNAWCCIDSPEFQSRYNGTRNAITEVGACIDMLNCVYKPGDTIVIVRGINDKGQCTVNELIDWYKQVLAELKSRIN